ncbi:M48 family metallopeptidase [Patescibacteria group bacterium]
MIRLFWKKRRRKRSAKTQQSKARSKQKEQARKLARGYICQRVEYYSECHGFAYNRVFIRCQRTRWGSCSSKKNLNFNMQLMLLREELVDYVVIHELCHTRHLNHSRDFWAEVERIIPNYKELRKELRKTEIRLV